MTKPLQSATPDYVAYYRVSTSKQGETGLGMQAQEACVESFAQFSGARIIARFTEVESGTRSDEDRPELEKAQARARRAGATLVVAKLDRLYRDVEFTAKLMKGDVHFVCCDNPFATPLTIHILAAVAQDEARRISQRTKDALAAYVANKRVSRRLVEQYKDEPGGVPSEIVERYAGKLGADDPRHRPLSPEAIAKGQKLGTAKIKAMARDRYADLEPEIRRLRQGGASLREIAGFLNGGEHQTAEGKPWGAVQVKRVLDRLVRDGAVSCLATFSVSR
jgi:DNA invertase Pin-like site-specific DNA recombinase